MEEGPKDLVPKEVQEYQPLETPSPPLVPNPINTTFSLVGDSNFVEFVDPAHIRGYLRSKMGLLRKMIK